MTSTPARLGSLLLVAVAVGSLGFVRCYSATEVVLDVRTSLACETFQPRTQIRTGEGQIVADTATCASLPGEDPSIGTLAFVPSGDREARVVVEVVLAVKGVRPEDCGAHPEKCIVAKRSFAFIEHSSRRLRVVLQDECLGKVCAAGQTCVEGGACVAIEAACLTAGCGNEPAPAPTTNVPPGVTPGSDAGAPGCPNGEIRCSGARLEQCREGAFELRDLCDTPDLCLARSGTVCGKIVTVPVCTSGDKKCDGGNVVRCKPDGSGFDNALTCVAGCTIVGGAPVCVTPTCTPGERKCDSACEISGASHGTTADDCIVKCNDGLTGFVFEQNCGVAQHGKESDSCRASAAGGGAECF